MDLTRPRLLELYYFIRLTRDIEERLTILYRQSKVVGGRTGASARKVSRSPPPTLSGPATRSRRSFATSARS